MRRNQAVRSILAGMVLVLVATASAQPAAVPRLYDPERDIVSPDVARWLYLGTMLYQAPLWSLGVSSGLDLSGKRATAIQLIGSPTTFFGFLWMTRDRRTTLGMVSASYQGALHGAAAGAVVGDLLANWENNDWMRVSSLTAVAGSVAGHIVGFRHAESQRLNWGNAEMLGLAGTCGAAYTALLASVAVPWDGWYFHEDYDEPPLRRKVVEAAGLAGWAAGLRFWHGAGPRDFTTGDAISMYCATGLSVYSGVAAYSLMPEEWQRSDQEWPHKAALASAALVNAAGLVYGYRFHRNRDLNFGQSLLVALGSGLGASSLGVGIAYLVTPEDQWSPDWRVVSVTSAAGGWLGFHLSHMLLDTDKPGEGRADAGGLGGRVHLMPANACGVLLASRTGGTCTAPLVAVDF